MLAPGSKAPDFSLSSKVEEGLRHVTLAEHTARGPVVLLFFPMAFTGVCTEEMCTVSQGLDSYRDAGATVLAISGDNPFAQEAWAKKERLTLPLLSDYDHRVAREYGVAYESFLPQFHLGMGGVAKRAAFVIDRGGIIRHAQSDDDPKKLPDFDAVRKAVAELGKSTPATRG